MELIDRFRRNRAIRAYIRKLPHLLARDYGRADHYTPRQIRSTVERSGLNTTYTCYAIAMFSDREEFDLYHRQMGEACDYDAMRQEIADCHFDGADFEAGAIFDRSSDLDGGGDDGGSDGGDGGGGD